HGLYRAGVVERQEDAGAGATWVVRVTDADRRPAVGARVSAGAWMPQGGVRMEPRPVVTELGGGRYRVRGLRFSRAGGWRVRLRVSADGLTDTVDFNLIVPAGAVRGGRGRG